MPFLSFEAFHKFYVSVTTVTYTDKHFEIILYTFPDDLEKAVKQKFNYNIDLDKADEKTKFYIASYLKDRFQITVNDRKIDYTYLGFTFENEKLLLLAESEKIKKPKRISITQKWLTDVYPDQQNIVHIIIAGKKFSEILNKDKTFFEVEVD